MDEILSGKPFKREHIQELRRAVNWGGAGGGGGGTAQPIPRDGHALLSFDATTNRITTAGFEYDAAGNQIRNVLADGVTKQRYQYDAAGKMVKVLSDNSQTILASYTYGATNQRLVGEENNLRTYYNWDGAAVSSEYSEVNSSGVIEWSKNYIYLGGKLIATQQPTGNGAELVQYHHPDRLGIRLITNAQDTNVQEQVTLPFGIALDAESNGASNRRFTSYDRSNVTGLDYAVNRHYDPQQGRFMQVDPIETDAVSLDDPQSLNMYTYCGNNPVNYVDPDGLFFGKLFRAIGRIIGKIVKIVAAAAAIFVAFVGVVIGQPELFIISGLLFAYAFGGATVQRILSAGAHLGRFRGLGPGGTPVWNPMAGSGLSPSAVSRYISQWQDGGTVTCPNFPDCTGVITLPTESVTIKETLRWWEKASDWITDFGEGWMDVQTFGVFGWIKNGLADITGLPIRRMRTDSAGYQVAEGIDTVASIILPTPGKFKAPLRHRKLIKKIVMNASKPGVVLSDAKIAQLRRVVERLGGTLRTEVGRQGVVNGVLHSQVRGFGQRIAGRHIIHQTQP
jgi:RHS repeat-associated protein